jgi:hypothetical protein
VLVQLGAVKDFDRLGRRRRVGHAPLVGSSSISRLGEVTSSIPTARRLRSPPLMPRTLMPPTCSAPRAVHFSGRINVRVGG